MFAALKVEEEANADAAAENDFCWLKNESFATAVKTDDARYCSCISLYYLLQGRLCFCHCLSASLFVCLLATLHFADAHGPHSSYN